MDFKEAREIVERSLKACKEGPGYHSEEWKDGFIRAFEWIKDRLPEFEQLYCLKEKQAPVAVPVFKVGQVVRRTSDGLKCLIHKNNMNYIHLVQLNNGLQFSTSIHSYGNDVTADQLLTISGGYTFVTEKQGREMGLAWAKEEQRRETANFIQQNVMTQRELTGGYSR